MADNKITQGWGGRDLAYVWVVPLNICADFDLYVYSLICDMNTFYMSINRLAICTSVRT